MMSTKNAIIVVVAVAQSAFCQLIASSDRIGLALAERGKAAEYSVVIPDKASHSQRYAAEELRDFTERTTGVRLPIVTDANPMPAKAILLELSRDSP